MEPVKRLRILVLLASLLLTGCHAEAAHGKEPGETIEPAPYASDESSFLHSCIDAFLFDGDVLPEKTPEGNVIFWTVESGHAVLEDYIIHKTDSAEEYEMITLSAVTDAERVRFTNLTLMDEAVGYVIAYFTSEGNDKEQLKLAYTYNSVYWFKLHHDEGILKPSIGTRRLRDPSLVRKPGGGFALLATQGYDTDSIYVYDSEDLTAFQNERLLKLNADGGALSMSEQQAWAPEAFYDPDRSCYVIVWSSPADGGIFYSLSTDLTDVTYPSRLNDPGYPVIDISFTHTAHGWTALLKDEREPMETYSEILRGTGVHWNAVTEFSDPVYDRHQTEGPMIMKALEKPGWYVIVDDYTRSAYKMLYTEDIENGTFEELDDLDLMIPLEKPSHAYALRVTWKELERLLNHYGDG